MNIPPVAVKREVFSFPEKDREWIRRKWLTVRNAHIEADKFGHTWQRLSDEINTFLDSTGIVDVVQRAKVRKANLALADAFAAGQWFRQEAQAHTQDIQLYLRLKELGLI